MADVKHGTSLRCDTTLKVVMVIGKLMVHMNSIYVINGNGDHASTILQVYS